MMPLAKTSRFLQLTTLLVVQAMVLSVATSASAQLFSPGVLHKQHSHLEGLSNCLECHESGNRLSDNKCLKCHTEIKVRRSKRRGFHGRTGRASPCYECHAEHKGLNSNLIVWKPSKSRFPHAQTGWILEGKHRKTNCKECHQTRRLKDSFVAKVLKRKKKRTTFLGLGTACIDCHFDEHRGQLKGECKRCHTPASFAPAKGFSHTKDARFRLTGKHRKVRCIKCHAETDDTTTSKRAFPAPVEFTFASYRPLKFRRCTDCHRDPHKGSRGRRCESCHSTRGWDRLNKKAMDIKFHKTTRFPLVGEHIGVSCEACHGPHGRKKAVFRGLPFARCDDCHHDAHVGQLNALQLVRDDGVVDPKLPTSANPPDRPDCRACHRESGFEPAFFEATDHNVTAFALNGAHVDVDCRSCHALEKRLAKKVSAKVRRTLRTQKRPTLVSSAVLELGIEQNDCARCHDDVHDAQFSMPIERKKACATCHVEDAFQNLDAFSHNRDATFALENKHADVACTHCHVADESKTTGDVPQLIYRETPSTCAGCHVDIHAGQFARAAEPVDCNRCHSDAGFESATKFDHQDPAFAAFALNGQHQDVDCRGCHPTVGNPSPAESGAEASVQWFRGVPQTCAGCHEDQHEGRFDAYAHAAVVDVVSAIEDNGGSPKSEATPRASPNKSKCVQCHSTNAWLPGKFAHERTGYDLVGAHGRADCAACHRGDFERSPPTSCGACHSDVHQQTFGQDCMGCHTQETWRSTTDVSAHLATAFPLIGRHGALPCTECHQDRRDRTFIGPSVTCAECHLRDYDRAGLVSVDHRRSRFGQDCRLCHQPARFRPAAMVSHARCYPLLRTNHQHVRCVDCHSTLAGTVADGSCQTRNQTCRNCHVHEQPEMDQRHLAVEGYEWESLKCVSCHSPR